ncbi:TPA: hypothetical protein ACH3X1_006619 [Trebouxia sp. C0004]
MIRACGTSLRRASAMASSDQAPWHGMRGVKRVTSEFKYLSNKIKKGEWPQMKDLTVVSDDMSRWRFKLCNFDNDMEGGKNLNDDLNILAALHNQDHILMECSFPADYPNKPFFLRIVSPRMCWYTGRTRQHSADYGIANMVCRIITCFLLCALFQIEKMLDWV